MSEDFVFDSVSGGEWVKGSDHVGEWVLIRVVSTSAREGSFGDQTVLEADWVWDLLGAGPKYFEYGTLNSDAYVAPKCVGKTLVVGKITQGIPKQKGWKGPIYLEQPEGPEMTQAIAKAKELLAAEKETRANAKAKAAKPKEAVVNPAEQELENLLGDL